MVGRTPVPRTPIAVRDHVVIIRHPFSDAPCTWTVDGDAGRSELGRAARLVRMDVTDGTGAEHIFVAQARHRVDVPASTVRSSRVAVCAGPPFSAVESAAESAAGEAA